MLTPVLTSHQPFCSAGAPHAGPLISASPRMEAEAPTLCNLPFGIKSNDWHSLKHFWSSSDLEQFHKHRLQHENYLKKQFLASCHCLSLSSLIYMSLSSSAVLCYCFKGHNINQLWINSISFFLNYRNNWEIQKHFSLTLLLKACIC